MGLLEAIILGLVQGLTEFLPISSSAHLRIVGELIGSSDPGAAFTAITQIGTEAADPGERQPGDVAGEGDEHGGLRAQLGDGGEGSAGVATEEHLGDDPQVRRGGDRQELGESLDQTEHDNFEPRHGA